MLAKVSTLLMQRGACPKGRTTPGTADAGRGTPRSPSTEAISAVSSPQTNAPAPSRTSTSKPKSTRRCRLPSRPRRSAWRMATLSRFDRQRIFGAAVDVALGRAHRVGGDGHALEHAVRIAFQHAAVHERAGIALVGVADDVLLPARRPWPRWPTSGRWDSRRRRGRAGRCG